MKKIIISLLVIIMTGLTNSQIVYAKEVENDYNKKSNLKTTEDENIQDESNKIENIQQENKETEDAKNTEIENTEIENTEIENIEIKNIDSEGIAPSSVKANNYGWILENNKYFYLDNNGDVKKGWLYNDGYWYYLDLFNGEMKTGWLLDSGDWYYLKDNGTMATGWILDSGHWYYLNDNGTMAKGWIKLDGYWYYLNDSGTMATGWSYINGNWYYHNSNGTMITGYKNIDNKSYYFTESGEMNNGLGLVVEARKHIGKAYVSGGNGPNSFDCSGLTKYVYKKMDIELYRTTYDQVKQGRYVNKNDLQMGDLVFTNGPASNPGHVGIYSGNGKYIHAANSRQGVIESSMYNYTTARRIID